MDMDVKQLQNTVVVKLDGELDMLMAEKLKKDIDERLRKKPIANLIIGMEKVSFIDSSGLGAIIGIYKKVNAGGGCMSMIGPQPSVRKVLLFSGIDKLINIYHAEQDVEGGFFKIK